MHITTAEQLLSKNILFKSISNISESPNRKVYNLYEIFQSVNMKDELVPTIDISPLFGTNLREKLNVAKEIDKACKGSGFFFASNHGVDCLDDLVRTTRKFHQSLSEEEKMDLAIVAYNKNNTTQIRNGYYLPVEGKKAVESYVS